MNFPGGLFSDAWTLAAWLPFGAALLASLRRAPWPRLLQASGIHVWLGAIVVTTLAWSLKAGIKPGLALHLLGAMTMVLAVGVHFAMLGLTVVLAAVTANADAGWAAFALNALVMAVVPVGVAAGVFRLVDSHLPNHFFVYVFVAAYLGGGVTIASAAMAGTALLLAAGVYPAEYLFAEYLPYFGLVAFSEAWISGVLVTMMVIYRPGWIATFDDARYLAGK